MIVLILFFLLVGPTVEINKKPTTVSSRGFLSKVALRATRPNGVVIYDDYLGYDNLQRG
ncbi:MAG: hypothetical protein ABIR24_07020 [Verrucomicrobiota bacterium]